MCYRLKSGHYFDEVIRRLWYTNGPYNLRRTVASIRKFTTMHFRNVVYLQHGGGDDSILVVQCICNFARVTFLQYMLVIK